MQTRKNKWGKLKFASHMGRLLHSQTPAHRCSTVMNWSLQKFSMAGSVISSGSMQISWQWGILPWWWLLLPLLLQSGPDLALWMHCVVVQPLLLVSLLFLCAFSTGIQALRVGAFYIIFAVLCAVHRTSVKDNCSMSTLSSSSVCLWARGTEALKRGVICSRSQHRGR